MRIARSLALFMIISAACIAPGRGGTAGGGGGTAGGGGGAGGGIACVLAPSTDWTDHEGGGGPFDSVQLEQREWAVGMWFNPTDPQCMLPDASVISEVTSSSDASVPSRTIGPATYQLFGPRLYGTAVIVSAADSRLGEYGVVARFEPQGAVHERRIAVAADRSATPAKFSLRSVTPACQHVAPTANESVVCRDGRVFRDGGVALTLPASFVSVRGNSIWTATPTAIHRFDDDGSLTLPAAQASVAAVPLALLPEDDTAIALWPGRALRYAVDGGALEEVESWTFDAGPSLDLVGAYEAPNLLVQSSSGLCTGVGAPAGTLTCTSAAGRPVGYTRGAVWSFDGRFKRRLPSGAVIEGPNLPERYSSVTPSGGGVAFGELPIVASNTVNLFFQRRIALTYDGGLFFTHWDFQLELAREDWAVTQVGDFYTFIPH